MLKWVRGEPLSQDHWMELFRLLHMPKGTTLEKLNFGHVLNASDEIIRNADALKELNQRAQGEVTIREAIRELDLWGAGAVFTLTEYEDSNKNGIMLIKDWKDLVNQVSRLSLYPRNIQLQYKCKLTQDSVIICRGHFLCQFTNLKSS